MLFLTGEPYLVLDVKDLFCVHYILLWEENRSAKRFGSTAVEYEDAPPQSSPDFPLEETDLPTRELFVKTQTHGHSDSQTEVVPASVRLVPFLGVVTQ